MSCSSSVTCLHEFYLFHVLLKLIFDGSLYYLHNMPLLEPFSLTEPDLTLESKISMCDIQCISVSSKASRQLSNIQNYIGFVHVYVTYQCWWGLFLWFLVVTGWVYKTYLCDLFKSWDKLSKIAPYCHSKAWNQLFISSSSELPSFRLFTSLLWV